MPPADDFIVPSTTKLQLTSKSLTLPTEVIYIIIRFLDPLELMRLQTISKQFHAIANDPKVWRKMYEEARCARFPGPLPWQSMRYLQRILVRSMKVEQAWTTQPLKVRISRQVHCDLDCGRPVDHRWVSHRWLIFHKGTEIISHHIEMDSQQTLWNNGLIFKWTACSAMSEKGHMIYLVLRIGDGDEHDAAKLLEFRADDDSGQLTGPVVFDIPVTCPEEDSFVYCTSAPEASFVLAVISWSSVDHIVVFDIRNRIFYKFPEFDSEVAEAQPFLTSWSPDDIEIFLTTPHVIVISQFYLDDEEFEEAYLIQAFAIPDSPIRDNTTVCDLRLSHETGGDGFWMPAIHLIQNSVVNSVDGSTTFRFMQAEWTEENFELNCTEFSLPRSRTNAILPLSTETQELFRVKRFPGGHRYDRAENVGVVRGFFALTGSNPSGWDPVLYKFSIDATGERCVATHGGPTGGFGLDGFHPQVSVIWFDGVRGRICYMKDRDDDDEEYAQSPYQVFVAELE